MQLTGFHHVTAITADAPGNHAFYTGVLGMRLVKKTVNQDDVSAYHLFYADGLGSPGTDVTFFDWPVAPERRGTNSISRIGLRVAGQTSLEWWAERFHTLGVRAAAITQRDGRAVLDFEDPEGQRLSLIDDGGQGSPSPWAASPVPEAHQIQGLGSLLISVPAIAPTGRVLTDVLNMHAARTYRDGGGEVHVYTMGEGHTPETELHVAVEPNAPQAKQGAGSVHHLALRTPDEVSYRAWADRLRDMHMPTSGPVDRYYFRSLYFREPGGILIEIATDGPGFAADEPLETLGQALALPPFLEPRRRAIEAGLKPLVSTRVHPAG